VSNLTERLDEQVRAWANRPREEKYPFLLADAMQLNIRHHEAVRSAMALIVIGISEDGYREILGLKTHLRETDESWKELLQELKDRGLRRVELATSDAHEGLESALREAFPGCIWQRCQSHFRRNVLGRCAFRLPGPDAGCTICLTRLLRPVPRRRPRAVLKRSPASWKRKPDLPLRSWRREFLTLPLQKLYRRSIAKGHRPPTCWSGSFRKSGGERR